MEAITSPNITQLKETLLQLPPKELITLYRDIEEQVETYEMMVLSETGFQEWLEPEEDIYDEEV